MLGFNVNQAKSYFFDRPVVSALDRAAKGALSKFGAFVRTTARSSIRKRKRVSDPGQPPSSHTGLLKRFLFFAYDALRQSVVVGPVPTNQVFFDGNRKPVRGTVPEVLEYGGAITILEVEINGKWFRHDIRATIREGNLPKRFRTARIDARPYMRPAFEKNRDLLVGLFRDSMKKAA